MYFVNNIYYMVYVFLGVKDKEASRFFFAGIPLS